MFFSEQQQLQDFNNSMSQLNDQNILLRAQLSAAAGNGTLGNFSHENSGQMEQLQNQIQLLANENSHLKTRINFYESEHQRLLEESNQLKMLQLSLQNSPDQQNGDYAENKLRMDQENLLELLSMQDAKLKAYKRQLRQLRNSGQSLPESLGNLSSTSSEEE